MIAHPRLKKLESLQPLIPLLVCAYLFLAADYFPSETPDQVGLIWQECQISESTYTDIDNWTQAERCFGQPAPVADSGETTGEEIEVSKPFFVKAFSPYWLNGKSIFIGRIGINYFVMFDGYKIGPTFNAIQFESCCDNDKLVVDSCQGRYIFRGSRGGQYFLVEISSLPQ